MKNRFGLSKNYDFVSKEYPQGILLFFHEEMYKKSTTFHMGRNRTVFDLKNYVVKVPRNGDGFGDNDWEGSVSNTPESKNDPDYIQYPHTRLYYIKEVPILFMEKVTHVTGSQKDLPDWVNSVDCGQVGYTSQGRLVAYDYGYN